MLFFLNGILKIFKIVFKYIFKGVRYFRRDFGRRKYLIKNVKRRDSL